MKAVERIFLFIFFIGMFTTVINYLPVIEEEVSSHKHSSSQTQKGKDSDGSEPVTDDEPDTGKEFHMPYALTMPTAVLCARRIRAANDSHFPSAPNDCTIPPRLRS